MIQRIQTFYLALIAALLLCMFFLPYAILNGTDFSYQFLVHGVYSLTDVPMRIFTTWPLFGILLVATGLPLFSIFMYKKRPLQMKFCAFIAVLLFAFYILFFGYWLILKDASLIDSTQLQATLIIPLVALVLDYMAFRKIAQDEVLVRSIDRIR